MLACLDFGFGRGGFPRLAWAGVLHTPSFRLPDLRAEANGPIALGDTAGTPSVQARRLGLGFIFCMSCSRRVGVSRCPHIPGTPCDATAGGLELRPSLRQTGHCVSVALLTWCCNWQIHWQVRRLIVLIRAVRLVEPVEAINTHKLPPQWGSCCAALLRHQESGGADHGRRIDVRRRANRAAIRRAATSTTVTAHRIGPA